MKISELYDAAVVAKARLAEPDVVNFDVSLQLPTALNLAVGKSMTKEASAETAVLYMSTLVELAKQTDARRSAEKDLKTILDCVRRFIEWQDQLAQGDFAIVQYAEMCETIARTR